MIPLLLIRHGRTLWNQAGRTQGRKDSPLTPEARAEVAAWRLPSGYQTAAWIVSPLGRARETAGLLGHGDAPVEPRLTEMSWGDWEGQRLDDLRAELGADMAGLESQGLDFRPPGGESPRELQQRLRPVLEERAGAGRPTVAVAHKGVVRAIYALAVGWDMKGPPPVKLRNGVAQEFLLDPGGRPSPGRLNIPLLEA
ncbi:MAG: histidine phosphatase family protein [Kiloniellales bacterium]|nr:histidine phosphatase family protein [Kiloniellales bacterium]